jgi:hypothetical protein
LAKIEGIAAVFGSEKVAFSVAFCLASSLIALE